MPATGSVRSAPGVLSTPANPQGRAARLQEEMMSIKTSAFIDELQQMGMPEEAIEKVAKLYYGE
jgi:DNA-binding transcriptional regulator YhcF (GntR family)